MIKKLVFKIFFLACSLTLILLTLSSTAYSSETASKTIIMFFKANKGKINVQIKGPARKNIQLYLFDTGGQLVRKTEGKASNIITLHNIESGQYLYQCFENDVELKSGNLLVFKNKIDYD